MLRTPPSVSTSAPTRRREVAVVPDKRPARREPSPPRHGAFHLHWFRWAGDEPLSNGSRYACRCGVVKPGM